MKKTAELALKTEFAQLAVCNRADLSAFQKKPGIKILTGIALIALSYLLGWPGVTFMAILAVKLSEPLVAVIGGPAIYFFSHLVFLTGMYLAGAEYSRIFLQWATRKFIEKYLHPSTIEKTLAGSRDTRPGI